VAWHRPSTVCSAKRDAGCKHNGLRDHHVIPRYADCILPSLDWTFVP